MKRVKPRKRCCKSRPRCKRCPVVCKRLETQGLAVREGKHLPRQPRRQEEDAEGRPSVGRALFRETGRRVRAAGDAGGAARSGARGRRVGAVVAHVRRRPAARPSAPRHAATCRRSGSRCSRAGARSPCASTPRCGAARTLRRHGPQGRRVRRHLVQRGRGVDPERRARAARVRVDDERHDLRRRGERDAADRRRAAGLRPRRGCTAEADASVRGAARRPAGRRRRAAAPSGLYLGTSSYEIVDHLQAPGHHPRRQGRPAGSPRAGRSPPSAAAARASSSSTSRR